MRFENIDPEVLEAKLDGNYVEINFKDSNVSGIQYGEIFLPGNDKNKMLEILDKANEKLVLSEEIIYLQAGDTINYYSNNVFSPRPIIVNNISCWTKSEGIKIPRNRNYKIHYELERNTKREGKDITRSLILKNVSFEDVESKKRHILSSNITHSKTVSNLFGLENETEILNSDTKIVLDIDLGNQLINKQFEYSTIIRGDGSPSFMVIEYVYGMNIKGVVSSCSEIDTLYSDKVVLPEFIQIGMNCK